jgi:hypothetical protein
MSVKSLARVHQDSPLIWRITVDVSKRNRAGLASKVLEILVVVANISEIRVVRSRLRVHERKKMGGEHGSATANRTRLAIKHHSRHAPGKHGTVGNGRGRKGCPPSGRGIVEDYRTCQLVSLDRPETITRKPAGLRERIGALLVTTVRC